MAPMFLSEFFTYLQSCEADEDDAASQRGKLCKVLQSMLSVADASLEDQVSKNLIVQLLPHAFHNLLGMCFIEWYFCKFNESFVCLSFRNVLKQH